MAGRFQEKQAQLFTDGFGKGDVRHDAAPKESVIQALLGAIDKLIDEHNVARTIPGLQRTDGAHTDDPVDAELFHGPDIGAMIELGWKQPMSSGVAWQEDDIASIQLPGQELVGRSTERRLNVDPFLAGEAFDLIQAASADDAYAMFLHNLIP